MVAVFDDPRRAARPMTPLLAIEAIEAARGHIDPAHLDTPVATSAALDAALGCHLLAKIETANPIGSFKARGADAFVATALAPGEAVACASAGNFGQGLARACARRGHACTVFVSRHANPLKVEALRRFGADVHVAGEDFDAAKDAARVYAGMHGLRFVEDGAEPAIAEGAGTIGLELAPGHAFDAITVPLGNGALLAGVGSALRLRAPRVEIVAVVARAAPAMQRSLVEGRVVRTDDAPTIADGIAVRVPIARTLGLLRRCCDDVVDVSEQHLVDAIVLLHRHLGLVAEPAGAAGVAAVLARPRRYAGRRVATIVCGANLAAPLRAQLLGA
ncbi:threonine ammonia-lyase [Dokdonella fugitiva]|jgi:threonine dehydratase|uniref:Threonine dehydratase n=1 Tax=Dokdonella fugitiva TaxID=328517 RepID=A0A4R2I528_9GAMM|nr:pyridoxal-phosphate dependent enzyme [Dokdonella fugitiva]TCO38916.1 threonine dehydratase [Dokdonella fugitiva]